MLNGYVYFWHDLYVNNCHVVCVPVCHPKEKLWKNYKKNYKTNWQDMCICVYECG